MYISYLQQKNITSLFLSVCSGLSLEWTEGYINGYNYQYKGVWRKEEIT